jgi:hypothetical protein
MTNHILKSLESQLKFVPKRLLGVASLYLLNLILPGGKRTIVRAEELSQKSRSCFSSFLQKPKRMTSAVLQELAKKLAHQLPKTPVVSKAPWRIAIIIDSTPHCRSKKVDNAQKHNQGKGWFVGHLWTNIVLRIDGVTIPLPPIPFYTKGYCEKHKIMYKTINAKVIEWIKRFDLESFVGQISPEQVVVLLDAGFDDRKIQKEIVARGWDFITSAKKSDLFDAGDGEHSLDSVFACAGFWKTIYTFTRGWKKRKDFRTCVRMAFFLD